MQICILPPLPMRSKIRHSHQCMCQVCSITLKSLYVVPRSLCVKILPSVSLDLCVCVLSIRDGECRLLMSRCTICASARQWSDGRNIRGGDGLLFTSATNRNKLQPHDSNVESRLSFSATLCSLNRHPEDLTRVSGIDDAVIPESLAVA